MANMNSIALVDNAARGMSAMRIVQVNGKKYGPARGESGATRPARRKACQEGTQEAQGRRRERLLCDAHIWSGRLLNNWAKGI